MYKLHVAGFRIWCSIAKTNVKKENLTEMFSFFKCIYFWPNSA